MTCIARIATFFACAQLLRPVSAEPEGSFAWKSTLQLAQTSKNMAYSPFSVREMLGLVYVGSQGPGVAQLAAVANFPDPITYRKQQKSRRALLQQLQPSVTFQSALAAFVQQPLKFSEAYRNLISTDFGALTESVDFATPAALARINDWVSQRTQGKIENLLAPGSVDRNTSLVLVNAVYLKARWRHPFPRHQTRPMPFYTGEVQITVPTMYQRQKFDYVATSQWAALEMPYAGDRLVFDCLLPSEGAKLSEVRQSLDWPTLSKALDEEMKPTTVSVSLPRFRLESSHQLLGPLKALGFPEALDVTPMLEGPDQLSAVVQKTFLQVDEEGTEAAAATAGMFTRGAQVGDSVEFRVDRPFLFLLRDRATGEVLFSGQVHWPEAPAPGGT